jgi:hypothetical protein
LSLYIHTAFLPSAFRKVIEIAMASAAIRIPRKQLESLGWTPGIVCGILRVIGLKPTRYEQNMELIRSLMRPSTMDGRDQSVIPGCSCGQCHQASVSVASFLPAYGPEGSPGYWSPIPGRVCTRESFDPQRFFFHVLKWNDRRKVNEFFNGVRHSKRLDQQKVIAAIVAQRLYADAPYGAEYKDLRSKLLKESVRLCMLCSAEGYAEVQKSSIDDWEAGRMSSKARASIACA